MPWIFCVRKGVKCMSLKNAIGAFIAARLMPASAAHPQLTVPHAEEGIQLTPLKIPSTNQAVIDGIEYLCTEETAIPPEDRKIIICALAGNRYYENETQVHQAMAREYPGHTIVAFNFRGVGNSTGKANKAQDWCDDALAVIKHYTDDKAIPPQNILLDGHSLGAAILTMAAKQKYHADYQQAQKDKASFGTVPTVRLFSDRSFSNLPDFIFHRTSKIAKAFFSTLYFAPLYPLLLLTGLSAAPFAFTLNIMASFFLVALAIPSISKKLVLPCIKKVITLTFGNMEALNDYRALPEKAKAYVSVKGEPISASIHQAFKATRKKMNNNNQYAMTKLKALRDSKLKLKHDRRTRDLHDCPLELLEARHRSRNPALSGEVLKNNTVRNLLGISP